MGRPRRGARPVSNFSQCVFQAKGHAREERFAREPALPAKRSTRETDGQRECVRTRLYSRRCSTFGCHRTRVSLKAHRFIPTATEGDSRGEELARRDLLRSAAHRRRSRDGRGGVYITHGDDPGGIINHAASPPRRLLVPVHRRVSRD